MDSIGGEMNEWGDNCLMMGCIRKMFPIFDGRCFSQLFLPQKIIEALQHPESGVPIRTVNSFINKIPSVFTGWAATVVGVSLKKRKTEMPFSWILRESP